MRRRNLCIVLLSVGAALAVAWYFFSHSRRGGALIQLYNVTRYENFRISGEVVDENGVPVKGVTLKVTAGRFVDAGTRSIDDIDSIKLTDSKFTVERKGVSSVRVRFLLNGFDAPHRDFIDGGTYNNVILTMRRQPPATTRSTAGPSR